MHQEYIIYAIKFPCGAKNHEVGTPPISVIYSLYPTDNMRQKIRFYLSPYIARSYVKIKTLDKASSA